MPRHNESSFNYATVSVGSMQMFYSILRIQGLSFTGGYLNQLAGSMLSNGRQVASGFIDAINLGLEEKNLLEAQKNQEKKGVVDFFDIDVIDEKVIEMYDRDSVTPKQLLSVFKENQLTQFRITKSYNAGYKDTSVKFVATKGNEEMITGLILFEFDDSGNKISTLQIVW